jgi:hypothetical protein
MTEPKKLKVTFAPGCFDKFEGTQEELDAFVKEIEEAVTSGELLGESRELTDDDWEELPKDIRMQIAKQLEDYDNDEERRSKLN